MAPVVVLGFDACDPATVRSLAARGDLPNFAEVFRTARTATVRTPYGFFVGAVWPTFATGRRANRHRYTCWNEIDPATYDRRRTHPDEIQGDTFWQRVAASGRRVAVIDVPHFPATPFPGVQVAEWGAHDRHYGLHSWPEPLAGELVDRHGFHPILGIDPLEPKQFAPDDWTHRAGPVRTPEEDAALLAGLLEGTERKSELSLDVFGREPWDLFVSVLGDTHAGGHHLWHHHDPRHPRHDPELSLAGPSDAIVRLYGAADAALGAHLAAAKGATVLVLLSHGMGPTLRRHPHARGGTASHRRSGSRWSSRLGPGESGEVDVGGGADDDPSPHERASGGRRPPCGSRPAAANVMARPRPGRTRCSRLLPIAEQHGHRWHPAERARA